MKLRRPLDQSAIARLFALRISAISVTTFGVTALGLTGCGDDEKGTVVSTVDAGNPLTPTDTSESSSAMTDTASSSELTGVVTPAETSSATPTAASGESTLTDTSASSVGTELSSASSSASPSSTGPVVGETSSETPVGQTTEVVEPCNSPSFAVFTRSDTAASWDDNDFSSVIMDGTQCPPGIYADVTWPHEEGWAFGDPSEANKEQVHFTLDAYAANNLVNKEITATVELVADERGPSANAGGYLVSIVSVSTFDRITIIPGVAEPDAGPDAGAPEPQTLTETGYSEAESPERDRILLRRVGDRATISFRLPAKTEAVDSYDPERVLKTNLRFYNVYEGLAPLPVEPEPLDAGASTVVEAADAAVDASVVPPASDLTENLIAPPPVVEGDPTLVYDYLTSRFLITKFVVSDVPAQ